MITGISLRAYRTHHRQRSVQQQVDKKNYHPLLKERPKDVIGSNGTLSPVLTVVATTLATVLGFGRIAYGLAIP